MTRLGSYGNFCLMVWSLALSLVGQQPLKSVPTIRKEVALTFDACQTEKLAGYDSKLIQILIDKKCKATLFLGGYWAETHAQVSKQLSQNKFFEIAQHSYKHPHFPKISANQMQSDLMQAQKTLHKITGQSPRYFRPPYGEYNSQTLSIADKLGLKTVLWSVVSGDPDQNISAKQMTKAILAQAKPGSIIIMHMNTRGWHTAEALPANLTELKKKGLTPVTLTELLRK